jgi:beta-lactamase regulating signal transducer with metallopeptidase domain
VAVWGIAALFWFHPLVWMARRALAREAEHAADDAVLGEGICASDYAALLVRLASGRRGGVALKVGSSLIGARVRAVLAPRVRSARRWPAWLAAGALILAAVPSLGAVSLWTTPAEALTCEPGMPGVPSDPWELVDPVFGPLDVGH